MYALLCFALLYLLDPVGVVVDDVEGSAISTSVDCITYGLFYVFLFSILCVCVCVCGWFVIFLYFILICNSMLFGILDIVLIVFHSTSVCVEPAKYLCYFDIPTKKRFHKSV